MNFIKKTFNRKIEKDSVERITKIFDDLNSKVISLESKINEIEEKYREDVCIMKRNIFEGKKINEKNILDFGKRIESLIKESEERSYGRFRSDLVEFKNDSRNNSIQIDETYYCQIKITEEKDNALDD